MSGTGSAAATAVLLLGLLVGLAVAQPSMDQAVKDLREAREGAASELSGIKNTDISIGLVSYNSTTTTLSLTIVNEGAEVLDLGEVDIMVNGTWVDGGPAMEGYLYPQGSVDVTLTNIVDPRSIRAVAPWGIADQTEDIIRT